MARGLVFSVESSTTSFAREVISYYSTSLGTLKQIKPKFKKKN